MEVQIDENSLARKRSRSRSKSPSVDTSEQNLKKRRIDTDEIVSCKSAETNGNDDINENLKENVSILEAEKKSDDNTNEESLNIISEDNIVKTNTSKISNKELEVHTVVVSQNEKILNDSEDPQVESPSVNTTEHDLKKRRIDTDEIVSCKSVEINGNDDINENPKENVSNSEAEKKSDSSEDSQAESPYVDTTEQSLKKRRIDTDEIVSCKSVEINGNDDINENPKENVSNSEVEKKSDNENTNEESLNIISEDNIVKTNTTKISNEELEVPTVVVSQNEEKILNDSEDPQAESADQKVFLEANNKKDTSHNQKDQEIINVEDESEVSNTLDISITDEKLKSDTDKASTATNLITPKKTKQDVPSRKLTPKLLQRKLEAEKRMQERQKEKEERLQKKREERERLQQLKELEIEKKKKEREEREQKLKKEREEKEEKKKKEREEKEQKRKEKEEKEEQKRKEREQEKQKKQQEMDEKKLKEEEKKQKEEEKKLKAAAAFANFFVAKKEEMLKREMEEEKKVQNSNFLDFELKSDMRLPLARRKNLTIEEKMKLENYIENQNENASYLKDLCSGKSIGKCVKTWPYEENVEADDVILVDLGETICEDKGSLQKHKAKFLYFHDNRRPAYYGTWRKKSQHIIPRKPFAEDTSLLNYEEDSDDDWEEEEQGESLNGSDDEAEKEKEDEKDDYEVDNDFFVPHGHLSDDEVDDEEVARLSPESMKQKLKLLKEEFDEDMKSKTLKLKPRSIGCIWYNKDGSNIDEAIDRYLQPLAVITRHFPITIKNRNDIPHLTNAKKIKEIDSELLAAFLKIVHGSSTKKIGLVSQFLNDLQKAENPVKISQRTLLTQIKQCAVREKCENQYRWIVHPDLVEKYNLNK